MLALMVGMRSTAPPVRPQTGRMAPLLDPAAALRLPAGRRVARPSGPRSTGRPHRAAQRSATVRRSYRALAATSPVGRSLLPGLWPEFADSGLACCRSLRHLRQRSVPRAVGERRRHRRARFASADRFRRQPGRGRAAVPAPVALVGRHSVRAQAARKKSRTSSNDPDAVLRRNAWRWRRVRGLWPAIAALPRADRARRPGSAGRMYARPSRLLARLAGSGSTAVGTFLPGSTALGADAMHLRRVSIDNGRSTSCIYERLHGAARASPVVAVRAGVGPTAVRPLEVSRMPIELPGFILERVYSPRKVSRHGADRAVALLADDDLGGALVLRVGVVDLVAVDEQDHVRILFDRARVVADDAVGEPRCRSGHGQVEDFVFAVGRAPRRRDPRRDRTAPSARSGRHRAARHSRRSSPGSGRTGSDCCLRNSSRAAPPSPAATRRGSPWRRAPRRTPRPAACRRSGCTGRSQLRSRAPPRVRLRGPKAPTTSMNRRWSAHR